MNVELLAVASQLSDDTDLVVQSRFDRHSATFRAASGNPAGESPVPASLANRIDRNSALALKAVEQLLVKLPPSAAKDRIGLYIGNVFAGWAYGETQLRHLIDGGPSAVHPFQATAWFPAAAQGELSILHGWRGPAKTFSGAKCAFAEAIMGAAIALSIGRVDFAVVGICESYVSDFVAWGAGLRNAAAVCAEGATFVLLSNSKLATSKAILVQLTSAATAIVGLEPTKPPAEWCELLFTTFRGYAEHGSSLELSLPLSDTTSVEISGLQG